VGSANSRDANYSMRRRDLIAATAGGVALGWPLLAFAQAAPGLPLVAVLQPSSSDQFKDGDAALRGGLNDEGFVEGKNFAFATRFADGEFDRLPALAAELAALKPRVIVASSAAVLPARKAAPTVPLVFTAFSADPIAAGLVETYARPSGMVTGNTMNAMGGEEALTTKRIGLFKELVPALARLGLIGTPKQGVFVAEQIGIKAASAKLGFEVVLLPIQTLDDVPGAFASGLRAGGDAFYISGEPFLFFNRAKVVELAASSGKPTVGVYPQWARAGLLMSYSQDALDGYRRAGAYAAKILAGAKPGDLPIEQASKFIFVINLKTAKALGVAVPPLLIARADEAVE